MTAKGEPGIELGSRAQLMIRARLDGATYEEIGARFGVTRERARQIVNENHGPSTAEVRASRAARETLRREGVQSEIREALEVMGPLSVPEMSELLDRSETEVKRLWPADLKGLRIRQGKSEQAWSDVEILLAIQRASIYEFPLTANSYRELVAVGQVRGPSLPRVGQRFGSWAAACEAAGVEHGQAWRDNYQSQWTDDELLGFVREYSSVSKASFSVQGYSSWRSAECPSAPSGMTLRNRFGSWTEIKRRALSPDGWTKQ